jgi:leucyl aminopeptidase
MRSGVRTARGARPSLWWSSRTAVVTVLAVVSAWAPATPAQERAEFARRAQPDSEVWITLATSDLQALRESSTDDDWSDHLQTYESNDELTVALVREEHLGALARAVHSRFRRCGGFVAHPSREAALDAFYFRPEYAAPSPDITYTIDNAAVAQALVAEVQAANIVDTINLLASNTTRYYTNSGGVNAANQLKARWEGYATGRSDVSVALYTHPTWAQPSVIATITGTTLPSEVIVIGGHLDSINSSSPSTGTAPGADDDASGVASLTEAFRAAMARGYRPQRTLKFMAYAAEEVGLRGSGEIAASYQSSGVNVVGVMQLDMTNYKGSTYDIVLMTDYTNAAQNSFIQSLIDTYLTGLTRSTSSCGYACSDHASWHNRGYAASIPFESLMSQYNPYIHTVNDTLSRSDTTAGHAAKFARLAAAYMAELAKGGLGSSDTTPPTTSITSPASGATVSGTVTVTASASDNVGVTRVEFFVDGALQTSDTTSPYSFAWNTTAFSNGAHTLSSKAYDAAGNVGTSAGVGVTVSNTGGGPQTAVYDATRKAPKCATVGSSCDSGPSLLLGRGTRGPEPNQPNTINSSCADGNSGTFHVDESNDRIKVSTVDGTSFAAGKTVRIDATVWAWTTPSSDKLDLYRAANAVSPAWTFVATLTPTVAGAQTLSATYTLPAGALQAVRARFRYGGSASSCASGSYNDHDDLIFAVQ